MTNFDQLKAWIRINRPDLDAEFSGALLDAVRVRLNEITGLSIQPLTILERGSKQFLDALKASEIAH